MISKTIIIALILVVILALGTYVVTATAMSNPSWAKVLAGFWSDGQISDSDFIQAVQYLVDESVIHVNPKIIEIEVIREVHAQTIPTDNGVLWESIGDLQDAVYSLQQEYELTVQHNYSQDIWDRIDQIQSKLNNVADTAHDNKILIDCEISKLCNQPIGGDPIFDFEGKYNELSQRYTQLAERVLELERNALE